MAKPRKPIADLIEELKSWLPNYDHGPADYPTLLWRILASLPGGDRAEDMGYEPFQLGWQEADQLGRVLESIQDTRDVEDLIDGLLEEGGEGVEERRRPSVRQTSDERYQGWANWETWNVALWFGNDRGLYDSVRRHPSRFTADSARDFVRKLLPNGTSDFRHHRRGRASAAYAKVNWQEIADDFNEMRGEEAAIGERRVSERSRPLRDTARPRPNQYPRRRPTRRR